MSCLLVFPNDALLEYVKKGEIKDRYFNPNNIFSEIHFITFAERECDIDDIQQTIGFAKGYIHRLPKLSTLDLFFPMRRLSEVYNIASQINFDVVRGFSSTYSGFFAVKTAYFKKVSSVLSIHTNFDDIRHQLLSRFDFLRFLKYSFTKYMLEKKVLHSATLIIAVYEFAMFYVFGQGVARNKVELIYNKVFLDKFFPPVFKGADNTIKVISVGNLEIGKGQRVLIDAIPMIDKNIFFTIVGKGPDALLLRNKVQEFGIEDRVTFIETVPNAILAELYREHDIFALPIKYGGICIPALEATASGLALVMPKPISESKAEIVWQYAEIVENTPEGFAESINKLARNSELRRSMINKGLSIIREYDGAIMEKKEADAYLRVMGNDYNG